MMKRKHIPIVITGLICFAAGAVTTWFTLHPITRAVAAWLNVGPLQEGVVVVEPDEGVIREHPVLRLSHGPDGTEWDFLIMGKSVTNSQNRILPLLNKLARYDRNIAVVLEPEPDVPFQSVSECISLVSTQGFHQFWIPDVLWGSTEVEHGRFFK